MWCIIGSGKGRLLFFLDTKRRLCGKERTAGKWRVRTGNARGGRRTMDEVWQVVMTASGMVNARIVTGRLEAEGIPTCLKYDVAGSLYAVTVDGLGAVEILVSAYDLTRAREVLAASYDGEMPEENAEQEE
jgi:hypothetical protein